VLVDEIVWLFVLVRDGGVNAGVVDEDPVGVLELLGKGVEITEGDGEDDLHVYNVSNN
jgi:hypothetical protein